MNMSFLGGVIYSYKTSGIPKNEIFRVQSYFTNLRKVDLSIRDGQYPYFSNHTGASEAVAEDYKNHPEKYAQYEADVFICKYSQAEIRPIWAIYPGTNMYQDIISEIRDISDRKVWVYCYIDESPTFIPEGYGECKRTLSLIAKTEGMNENEVMEMIKATQINLQIGLFSDKGRRVAFELPVFYQGD